MAAIDTLLFLTFRPLADFEKKDMILTVYASVVLRLEYLTSRTLYMLAFLLVSRVIRNQLSLPIEPHFKSIFSLIETEQF